MMNDIKNLDYYLSLPYGITLRKDDESDWVARVQELPGCTAHGETQAKALERLEEVKTAWIEDAIEAGDAIPEPNVEEELPSGKWLQRVPRSLHKSLTDTAKREGVSLNQFVTTLLAEAVGTRKQGYALVANSPIEAKGWSAVRANLYASQCDLTEASIDQEVWLADPHKPAEFVIEVLASKMLSIPHHAHPLQVSRRALPTSAHICSWGSWNEKKLGTKSMQDYFMVNERADKKEPARKS
jgi:antitoxin HicB